MKTTFTNKLLLSVGVAALAMSAGTANAQTTEPVTATVQVLNAITVTEVDPLDFGIVAVISHNVNTATLTINPLTDALTTATTGAPATFAVVDGTNASAASLTIEDAAVGAALNYTIGNVVNPISGGNAFTLNGWQVSYNGGVAAARTAGTAFPHTFTLAPAPNTIDIGANLVTQVGVALYPDATYTGSFDLTVSY